MRAWTLGSGSSGNSIVLETGGQRILIDCGFGPRAVATRLKAVGIEPESIAGILVTHEHVDHAQGVGRAQHKWRWPVIASPGTLDAIGGIPDRWRRPVHPGAPLAFEGLEIQAFDIPHDASAPSAFLVTSRSSGERAGIAHDLGEVPEALVAGFRDAELLLIEANHDTEMLRNGPYPPRLQDRIRGRLGHLSNAQSAEWAVACAGPATREIVLLHLSEQNNTPEVAERTLRGALSRGRFRGRVMAAPRKTPALVAGHANGRSGSAVQMALGL